MMVVMIMTTRLFFILTQLGLHGGNPIPDTHTHSDLLLGAAACKQGTMKQTQDCNIAVDNAFDEYSNDVGKKISKCTGGTWVDTGMCLAQKPDGWYHYGSNMIGGYAAAEWDYGQSQTGYNSGATGWSHYIRAFDFLRDTPLTEIGWGHWSKPSLPAKGVSVCGISPKGFTCDELPPTNAEMNGELKNCGYLDYKKLEKCKVWCCGEEDKDTSRQVHDTSCHQRKLRDLRGHLPARSPPALHAPGGGGAGEQPAAGAQ